MTRALVVYESLPGDARTVAFAVADGLASALRAQAVPVAQAPAEIDGDVLLLVVGGPGPRSGTPPAAPRVAVGPADAHPADPAPDLLDWLATVRVPGGDLRAAAFDTRVAGQPLPTTPEHADRTAEELLVRLGARVVAAAEHFSVVDGAGPLEPGEEERARQWGRALAHLAFGRALTG